MTLHTVCQATDLEPGTALRVVIDGTPVALVHTDNDEWYAIEDECTHAGASLSAGKLSGCTLECPGHGARFDVTTGRPDDGPAFLPVKTYPVVLDGDAVAVDVEGAK